MSNLNAQEMIKRAKARLIMSQPFFSTLLFHLPISEDKAVKTASTNGKSIKYNPEFIEALSIDEVQFLLAHEAMHAAMLHCTRRGERNPKGWNIATDYVINELLSEQRVGVMPEGGLLNPELTKAGNYTAEGVYGLLPEDKDGNKDKGEGGQGGGPLDELEDDAETAQDEDKQAQNEREWKVIINQASIAQRLAGKMTGGLKRTVDSILKPSVDWRSALRIFMSQSIKETPSYAKPKRRFLSEDIILPSLIGEGMGSIAVAIDCSGSINQDLLAKFSAEVRAIAQDLNPKSLEVIYFDHSICATKTFTTEDYSNLELEMQGGGGTAFSPIFSYVNEMPEPPVCVVVLTDLYCDDYGNTPDYPVLWASTTGDGHEVPFGSILPIGME